MAPPAKTKELHGGSALRALGPAGATRLVALGAAMMVGLWLLSLLLSDGGLAGALPASFRAPKRGGSGRERAAAAAAARAVQEAYTQDGGGRRGLGGGAHEHEAEAQDEGDFVAETHGSPVEGGCENPPSTALSKAFATERFSAWRRCSGGGRERVRLRLSPRLAWLYSPPPPCVRSAGEDCAAAGCG